jgi:hypothetical protein
VNLDGLRKSIVPHRPALPRRGPLLFIMPDIFFLNHRRSATRAIFNSRADNHGLSRRSNISSFGSDGLSPCKLSAPPISGMPALRLPWAKRARRARHLKWFMPRAVNSRIVELDLSRSRTAACLSIACLSIASGSGQCMPRKQQRCVVQPGYHASGTGRVCGGDGPRGCVAWAFSLHLGIK